MAYQKPRGTMDWYGTEMEHYEAITSILTDLAWIYHYQPIQTPTFEHLELFNKSVGETSDIVTKELYSFQDKGERWLALRPEGTAGVVRAYVENKLYGNQTRPLKLSYLMNLFRYERPQGGRMREFHQFGVEVLGTTNILDDLEVIQFADEIIRIFQLKNVVLHINYLGTFSQRAQWMEALKEYFSQYTAELTADSKARLHKNPLRILDDKVDGKKDFVKNAPKLNQFLDHNERVRFAQLCEGLDAVGIDYVVDDTLVRGLDYYTGTVFEFVSQSPALVGKATILGGGRYGRLVAQTGGPDVEGIGFAVGIERLLLAVEADNPSFFQRESYLDAYVVALDDASGISALSLTQELRRHGLMVDIWNGETRRDKNVKLARKEGAQFIVFVQNGCEAEIEDLEGNRMAMDLTEITPTLLEHLGETNDETKE